MDFGEILTRAWHITWKYKILWVFGIMAGCGGVAGQSNFSIGRGGEGGPENIPGNVPLPPQFDQFFGGFQRLLAGFNESELFVIGLVAAVLGLLFTVVILLLSTAGRIGLVQGTVRGDQDVAALTFSDLFENIRPLFLRVLGLNVLLAVVLAVAGGLLAIAIGVSAIFTLGLALICIIPLICLLIPAAWLVSVWVEQANIALIVDDLTIGESLQKGWAIFRENLGVMIVMGLILFIGVGLVGGYIINLPLGLIALPALLAVFSSSTQGATAGLLISGLCLVAYIPVMILLAGVLQTFIRSAWTLTYLRLTGLQLAPEAPFEPESPPGDGEASPEPVLEEGPELDEDERQADAEKDESSEQGVEEGDEDKDLGTAAAAGALMGAVSLGQAVELTSRELDEDESPVREEEVPSEGIETVVSGGVVEEDVPLAGIETVVSGGVVEEEVPLDGIETVVSGGVVEEEVPLAGIETVVSGGVAEEEVPLAGIETVVSGGVVEEVLDEEVLDEEVSALEEPLAALDEEAVLPSADEDLGDMMATVFEEAVPEAEGEAESETAAEVESPEAEAEIEEGLPAEALGTVLEFDTPDVEEEVLEVIEFETLDVEEEVLEVVEFDTPDVDEEVLEVIESDTPMDDEAAEEEVLEVIEFDTIEAEDEVLETPAVEIVEEVLDEEVPDEEVLDEEGPDEEVPALEEPLAALDEEAVLPSADEDLGDMMATVFEEAVPEAEGEVEAEPAAEVESPDAEAEIEEGLPAEALGTVLEFDTPDVEEEVLEVIEFETLDVEEEVLEVVEFDTPDVDEEVLEVIESDTPMDDEAAEEEVLEVIEFDTIEAEDEVLETPAVEIVEEVLDEEVPDEEVLDEEGPDEEVPALEEPLAALDEEAVLPSADEDLGDMMATVFEEAVPEAEGEVEAEPAAEVESPDAEAEIEEGLPAEALGTVLEFDTPDVEEEVLEVIEFDTPDVDEEVLEVIESDTPMDDEAVEEEVLEVIEFDTIEAEDEVLETPAVEIVEEVLDEEVPDEEVQDEEVSDEEVPALEEPLAALDEEAVLPSADEDLGDMMATVFEEEVGEADADSTSEMPEAKVDEEGLENRGELISDWEAPAAGSTDATMLSSFRPDQLFESSPSEDTGATEISEEPDQAGETLPGEFERASKLDALDVEIGDKVQIPPIVTEEDPTPAPTDPRSGDETILTSWSPEKSLSSDPEEVLARAEPPVGPSSLGDSGELEIPPENLETSDELADEETTAAFPGLEADPETEATAPESDQTSEEVDDSESTAAFPSPVEESPGEGTWDPSSEATILTSWSPEKTAPDDSEPENDTDSEDEESD